jgi:hypothetical protein
MEILVAGLLIIIIHEKKSRPSLSLKRLAVNREKVNG